MNIVISFGGLSSGQDSRPYALRHLAGGTILSHILYHVLDLPCERVIVLLEGGEEAVKRWAEQHIPDVILETIRVKGGTDLLTAATECADRVIGRPLLFVAGHNIAAANYDRLIASQQPVCCLLQSEGEAVSGDPVTLDAGGRVIRGGSEQAKWAGSCWFQDGAYLLGALSRWEGNGRPRLPDILYELVGDGYQVSSERAVYCLDTRTKEDMLYANARLLGLSLGSEDAIARSYAEDFTVLPPVFLHETAVIENSVVGPFVNLEAGASVVNSVVRNTLIGESAQLTNVVLGSSIIGEKAVVSGKSWSVVVDDESRLEL